MHEQQIFMMELLFHLSGNLVTVYDLIERVRVVA
jgi:hypothetical protein